MESIKKLTQTEEEIMHVIWQLGKAFVKDIIAQLPEPQPPYNTVSSVVRILESKGFVGYKAYGKTYEYYPLISKATYRKWLLGNLVSHYFNGSYQQLVSFFAKEEQLKPDEIEQLLRNLDDEKP
jgi:BlaI family penicillinase repressor